MGLRGPAPAPTALKIMRGNPGKRPINKSEPKPRKFKSKPPDHLDPEAVAEWKRLVPILKRMKVLTEADYMALGTLCVAYSTMAKAQKQLTTAGLLYKTQSGYVQPSPLMGIITRNMEIVKKHLAEFGMTPASRSRIQMAPADEQPRDEWEERDRRMTESA